MLITFCFIDTIGILLCDIFISIVLSFQISFKSIWIKACWSAAGRQIFDLCMSIVRSDLNCQFIMIDPLIRCPAVSQTICL